MINKNLYKKIQENIPICCVDLIIKNSKGEFLLLKRKNEPAKGQWWPVGGRVKKGESLEETAKRKAKEEAGLDVVLKKALGVGETIFKNGPFGNSVHTINIVFLAVCDKKYEVKIDNQSSDFKWLKKADKSCNYYVKKFVEPGSRMKIVKMSE